VQVSIVLVVEEDARFRDDLARLLTHAGHSAKVSRSSLEAVDLLPHLQPALTVINADMTGMSGWDLVRKIRGSKTLGDVPILFLLASTDPDARLKAMRLGVDDVMSMDLGPEEVAARVERCLGRIMQERDASSASRALRSGFAGDLSVLNAPGLLSMMASERKTGSVMLQNGDQRGVLLLREGRVVHARISSTGETGPDAAITLLSWRDGQFFFTWEPISVEDLIGVPTTHLILEAARLVDEQRRQDPTE
jgi:DNA-binding response OmpR family regulator